MNFFKIVWDIHEGIDAWTYGAMLEEISKRIAEEASGDISEKSRGLISRLMFWELSWETPEEVRRRIPE